MSLSVRHPDQVIVVVQKHPTQAMVVSVYPRLRRAAIMMCYPDGRQITEPSVLVRLPKRRTRRRLEATNAAQ